MAPAYKLTYFDFRTLAEPIRFLLKYGGLDFEDIRVDREKWPEIKENYPLGQLPVLEKDGKTCSQSIAICRYLAHELKLVGKNHWENMEIDAVVDTLVDLRLKILTAAFHEKDEKVKAEKLKTLNDETIPYILGRLEQMAKNNGGHLAVGKLTWADLFFAPTMELISLGMKRNLIANYPNLSKVEKNVLSLPAIKKWIETRPKSEF